MFDDENKETVEFIADLMQERIQAKTSFEELKIIVAEVLKRVEKEYNVKFNSKLLFDSKRNLIELTFTKRSKEE